MKLYQIIDREFQNAVAELADSPVSVAVGYRLTDLLDKIVAECNKFKVVHQKLIIKHAQKDKSGKLKTNKEKTEYLIKNREVFDKEYSELISLEIEFPKIAIDDIKDLKLSTRCISKLKPLIIP